MRLIASVVATLWCVSTIASADPNLLPRIMWSAFQCSYFAASSDDEDGAERLFLVGYESGQDLFEAIEEGAVDSERLFSETPIGVSLVWSGPSEEFVMGRIFESATREAAEILTKETPSEQWDDELRGMTAKRLFQDRNCVLLEDRP